jgi:hypothetical protein
MKYAVARLLPDNYYYKALGRLKITHCGETPLNSRHSARAEQSGVIEN